MMVSGGGLDGDTAPAIPPVPSTAPITAIIWTHDQTTRTSSDRPVAVPATGREDDEYDARSVRRSLCGDGFDAVDDPGFCPAGEQHWPS
jgi:hypothetical protein